MTSIIQPLVQGIIDTVKCTYKRQMIGKLLLNLELKQETETEKMDKAILAIENLGHWQSWPFYGHWNGGSIAEGNKALDHHQVLQALKWL